MSTRAPDPFRIDFGSSMLREGGLAERVAILTERQRQLWNLNRSSWIVIPSVLSGELSWLLVATDSEGERRGREVIQAFVGPAVGSISLGRLEVGSEGDPSRVLLEMGLDHVAVVRDVDSTNELLEALELMTAVRAGEPELRRDVADPIGFLLRDFHLAVSSGDPSMSERLIERLEAAGLLSSENLRFLRIERLAKLARWHELGGLPWFADLARSRRPRHITEYLLEALWRREFDDPALIAEPGAALRRFEERDLHNQFRSLLDAVDVPSSPSGRRLVWLATIAAGNDSREARLLASVGDAERKILEQLAYRGPPTPEPPPEQSPLERARALVEAGDFVGAIAAAEEAPNDPSAAAHAVRVAFEVSDPDLASRAVALADGVGEQALPATPGFRSNLREVRQLAMNQCPGWAAWFARVAAELPWPEAAEVARSLSMGWDPSELRQQHIADAAANDMLTAADGANALQVRAALDLICDLASELGGTGAASLTDAALLVLSIQDNPSHAVRNAFFSLTADVLAAGPTATRYADLVKTASALWGRVRSRDTVTWALDIADLLAASPCPNPGARMSFITSIGLGIAEFASRIPKHERSMLETLAEECGTIVTLPPLPEELPEASYEDVWIALAGTLVGLYSLLGGAGPRFADRIHALNAEARVEHNSDVVATEALRNLAMTADFFIVDTRHAAHAATAAIDTVRPRGRQLLPVGRGVSSFVSVLREALERDHAVA